MGVVKMKRWLELLAERISNSYSITSVGHVARVNGLDLEEGRDLCGLLREHLGFPWDVAVVADQPEEAYDIALDVAVERRNDKSMSRLFIVPANLVSEAAASLVDTEAHDVTEFLRPIADTLSRRLPREVRALVDEAMKHTSSSSRLNFLCGLPVNPTAADCGRQFWRLGLIPDFSPSIDRLATNRDCVAKLTDLRKTIGSIHQRVEATGLGDPNSRERLLKLLRETSDVEEGSWLKRIADELELGLSFDQWKFPQKEQVNLRAIEVHSFVDSRKDRPYAWSGLSLSEQTLRVSATDKKAKVTVRWSTEPESPTGEPIYEVALETSEPQPVSLLDDHQKHKTSKTQSWSFRPQEIESVEGGSLRVRVVVRYLEGLEEAIAGESDEFLLVSESVEAAGVTVFPPARSIPDCLLERAISSKAPPLITRCTVEQGSAVKVELDERQYRRIVLNSVLHAAERRMLEDPTKSCALRLELEPEVRWTADQLNAVPISNEFENVFDSKWWAIRSRLFSNIAEGREGRGIVEACELAEFTEDIVSYCRGYADALERVLNSKGSDDKTLPLLEVLVQLDSIQIRWSEAKSSQKDMKVMGLLVSPLHPIRLMWHLAHESLIREWINRASDRSDRVALPKMQTAACLDGANYPAFLGNLHSAMYHADSPIFHWPLFLASELDDPHRFTSLVRWGLGLGTLDTLAIGQEIAAEALAERLRTYAELHPYVHTLQVNAVNIGDGQLLVKALSSLDEKLNHKSNDSDDSDSPRPNLDYQVRLYGPSPVYRIGAFLDECANWRRHGQGLPQKLDRLFRPAESFLHPHLFWAKRELRQIEESEGNPLEEAHISFVTEYFRPQTAIVKEDAGNVGNCVSTYGLQTDLANDFTSDDGALSWIRTVRFPSGSVVPEHSSDGRFTSEILRLHRLLLKAVARICGGRENDWPATRVPISAHQFQLFEKLHESSDWVLTVDRNLGIELFDSPLAIHGDLVDNAKRYLVDYFPERLGGGSQQLMISTSWVEEVSGLLRETLREMLISPTDLACEEVLQLLKSISGRLVMRVARYPEVAKEAVSLAVVREVLRGNGELDNAFLVPVDEHIPVFATASRGNVSVETHRPDLLLVRPSLDDSSTLEIDIIEVKYRRHRSLAYDRGLWLEMLQKTQAAEGNISATYFPSVPASQLDLPIQRHLLKGILAFYARRALRYGLLDSEDGSQIIHWFDNLEREDVVLRVKQRGFVYCPELNFETEDQTQDDMRITLIGREALPRYTSFHVAEPSPADLLLSDENLMEFSGPSNNGNDGSVEPEVVIASEPLSSNTGDARKKSLSATVDVRGSVDDELEILLGRRQSDEKKIYFRPSLRGNPHALIVGIPGMGKTTAVLNVCRALAQGKVNPFVIDFHGDIARELQSSSSGDQCYVLNASKGLPFNPLEVDKIRREQDRGWKIHYYEVAEILASIYPSFGELQVGVLRDALRQCYEAAGFQRSPRDASAPLFSEFWRVLCKKADVSRDVRKITTRLESVFDLRLFREDANESFSLEDLLAQVTVVDLHGLDLEEHQRVAASFFLQRLYRDMFGHSETTRLRNAVIFDEAHRVARLSLIPKMMQECRKYGILFILSSQRVEDFDQGVLDSAGNHLYLRVNHPDARRLAAYLGNSAGASDSISKLQNLPKYHALFRSEDYQPFAAIRLAEP